MATKHETHARVGRRGRSLVLIAVIVAVSMVITACGSDSESSAGGAGDAKVYAGIGSASSEYWASFGDGAEAVASSTDTPFQALASEFDGQKHLQQFGSLFARGCESCAVTIDPASTAFTKALVRDAVDGGAWIVTLWNKPDDFHPWEEDEHWVAHTTFDGVDSGYQNTKALIEAIGGKGNIVALRGIPDNPPAIGRRAGMMKALSEHPDVKLLEEQVGDWDPNKGQQITETWLSKYGDRIDGIFSANDGMALGAIEALRARGLNGKVPVTGSDGSADALRAVEDGDMVSTMFIDPAVQGAVTAALGYAAAVGDIDPSELSQEQREFYLQQELVTQDNVDEFLNRESDSSAYAYEELKKDFWAYSAGPIVYGEE